MKILASTFLLIISFFIQSKYIFPQEKIETSFEQKEDKIFIYYVLKGDSQKEYEIEDVILKRKNDPNFRLSPSDLSGDIGKGKYAESRRTIIWTVNENEQNVLSQVADAEDFQIEITASVVKESSTWYYYVGGAALLGGGAAAILLLGKKESSPDNSNFSFPAPPGRP